MECEQKSKIRQQRKGTKKNWLGYVFFVWKNDSFFSIGGFFVTCFYYYLKIHSLNTIHYSSTFEHIVVYTAPCLGAQCWNVGWKRMDGKRKCFRAKESHESLVWLVGKTMDDTLEVNTRKCTSKASPSGEEKQQAGWRESAPPWQELCRKRTAPSVEHCYTRPCHRCRCTIDTRSDRPDCAHSCSSCRDRATSSNA